LCDSRKSHGFSVIRPVSTIVIPTRQQQFIFDALQVYLSSQLNNKTVDDVFMKYILKKGEEYYKRVSFSDSGLDYNEYMQSVGSLANLIQDKFNITRTGEYVDKLFPAVAILKTLMAMRNVSISPYMFRPYVTDYLGITDQDIDPYQVIEQSSKLMYVTACIKKVNSFQKSVGKDLKGIVIYSNLGTRPGKNSPVSLLKILKQYLLDESKGFGYSSNSIEYEGFRKKFDQVEILDGTTAADPKKKNALMNLFNKGEIKVIITTIREGVDLNGDTIALFNLSVDWNPTDAKQIEGRAWRQGNKNAYCMMIYPLTANGSDMAIYQKLQDKTYRLKALWDKSSTLKSAFDLDEFDPEELKMQMISRVEKLAPFKFNEETTAKRYEYDMLKSKKTEDEQVINNYNNFQAKEMQLRYAMMLYSRLPKILERENKIREIQNNIDSSERAVKQYERTIQEEKYNISEYQDLQTLINNIASKTTEKKMKAGEYGIALSDDQTSEAAALKKEIDLLNVEIKKLEAEKPKLEKEVDKKAAESIKEFEKELSKEQKELAKLKKSIEGYQTDPIFINDTKELEFNPDDQVRGNYFIKSETGGVIYKDKGLSLDKIDWLKATIYDLMEGLTRIVEMYTNINSMFSVAFSEYRSETIDLTDINNRYSILPIEYFNQFVDYTGAYNGESIYVRTILNLVRDFNSRGYTKEYWNLFYAAQLKVSILRSLRDYASILEGQDPDKYLNDLDEKLNLLYQEIGATENMLEIPESVLEKYIEKAYEEISKRRKEYSSYINLVDGFAGFSDLFNIELESVFINNNITKELAEEATIQLTEEVVSQNEAKEIIQAYSDKIEVYREMVLEIESETDKQAFLDKIEVYEEMMQEIQK